MKNTIQLPFVKREVPQPELVHKNKLLIHTNMGIIPITKEDIVFLKSDSNYCEIHTKEGKKICCSRTLKYVSSKLPLSNFMRIHNSYVVNVGLITFIDTSYAFVHVVGNSKVPVARSKRESFKKRLMLYFDS
ncbi:MAG: LytTR family DNA-binding domain-containing protein [Bacteroidota bacterium]